MMMNGRRKDTKEMMIGRRKKAKEKEGMSLHFWLRAVKRHVTLASQQWSVVESSEEVGNWRSGRMRRRKGKVRERVGKISVLFWPQEIRSSRRAGALAAERGCDEGRRGKT